MNDKSTTCKTRPIVEMWKQDCDSLPRVFYACMRATSYDCDFSGDFNIILGGFGLLKEDKGKRVFVCLFVCLLKG